VKPSVEQLKKVIIETAETKGLSIDKVFSSFVEMTYQYMISKTIANEFSDLEEAFNLYYETYLLAVDSHPFKDIYSELMNELNSYDKKFLGQCMTPYSVVSGIIKMLTPSFLPKSFKSCEPTCGTGTKVLKMLELFVNSESPTFDYIINDLDNRMVKIAAIQSVYNLHQNSDRAKNVNLLAMNVDLISEWNVRNKVVFSNDIRIINDEYIVNYVENEDRKRFLMFCNHYLVTAQS